MTAVTKLTRNTFSEKPSISEPKRPGLGRKSKSAWGYLFLLPWLIGFFGLTVLPMLASLYFSFTNYNMLQSAKWTGFKNYFQLFSDPRYLQTLKVTGIYVVLAVPLELAAALGLALLLNNRLKGMNLLRAVYYLPSLLGGSVAIAVLWREMFGTGGLALQLLTAIGIKLPSLIASPSTSLYTLILLQVWQFGSPMVIFVAGLRQIPADIYDAAVLDGAGRGAIFRRITLPLLTPVIFFNLVLRVITSFQIFTPAFIISDGSGGPTDSTLVYSLYMYQQGFTNLKMGYASAMAWVLLLIVGSVTALNFALSKRWVFYTDVEA